MLVARSPLMTIAGFLIAVAYGITFPLLSIRLEATGVEGLWIGLNAAMPAVGWIIGEMAVPLLQIRLGLPLKRLLQLLLVIAIVALAALRYAETYPAMTGLRLLFGGSIGVFFRCFEYWINDASEDANRARSLASFGILFMIGLLVGSMVQPELGSRDWQAFAPPLLLLCGGLLVLQVWDGRPASVIPTGLPPGAMSLLWLIPLAVLSVLTYGAYESVPTTLIEVYALRNGFDSATAAYTLTAVAAGNLLVQYPLAAWSDRVGRSLPLGLCALIAAIAAAAIPQTLDNATLFLATVAVLGGSAGATYAMALAMVGDRFEGAQLVVANAAFGIVYAAGSIIGPLVNGFAIGQLKSHGLMVSLALIFAILAIAVGISVKAASMRTVHAAKR